MEATAPPDAAPVEFFRSQLIESLGRGSPAMIALDARGEPVAWNPAFEVMVDGAPDRGALISMVQEVLDTNWRIPMSAGCRCCEPGCRSVDFVVTQVRYRLRCIEIAAGLLNDQAITLVTMERLTTSRDAGLYAESFGLTPRERQVAALVARGRSNKAIAHELGISLHTARHHTARVLGKLGVKSRAAAAAILNR